MKAIIIQPSNKPTTKDKKGYAYSCEPVGACYVSEYLKQNGYQSQVYHHTGNDSAVLKKIKKEKPDVAGFSTMTYNFNHGRHLARLIKEKNGHIPIIFCGYHVSALPLEICAYPKIDYVVVPDFGHLPNLHSP